jgi:amino acid adenylation domain-containing protein
MIQRHDKASQAEVVATGGAPLSFGQQRMWFLDKLVSGSSFYHLSSAVRLTGALDVDALSRAVREVVDRHEVLRCRIQVTDGIPVQFPADSPALEVIDLSGDAALDRAREAMLERSRLPFDLSRGPMARMCLARVAEQEHVLGVTLHHIAADAWSFGIMFDEIARLYEAFSLGRESPLPALPAQYRDFAAGQRERLEDGRLGADLEFWRRELAGAPSAIELPLDRPRPKMASYAGASVPLQVKPELAAALRKIARQERSTLFMVLLAAFGVMLVRWTGQDDIVVGVPAAGRGRKEFDGLIGFFVNTVAMRLGYSGDPAFAELVRQVRATTLNALAHQELPFDALVDELNPERDLGRNPLVQVVFQLENTSRGEKVDQARWAGVDAEWLPWNDLTTTRFDLSVMLTEAEGGLRGELVYATELFDRETAQRAARWYLHVLELVAADSGTRLSQLRLDNAVRVSPWRAGGGGERAATVGELFLAQAARTPDAEAVACLGRALSYAELSARAIGLAGRLRRMGVGPEATVGVCLHPSLELIVAIMGIVLAGGAYVPVDPESPGERVTSILKDAAARVVVTTSRAAAGRDLSGAAAVYLDVGHEVARDGLARDGAVVPDPTPAAGPENLLNVIYTSGSTGRPKGVMVRHAHVTDYVTWCLQHLPVMEGGSVPLTSSVSFAGVTLSLFGALLSGRRLVVPDPDDQFSWCADRAEYAFVKLTPSALRYAWHRFGPCWGRWSCVILASEPVRRTDLELVQSVPGVRVVVHYGSTETNGSAVWWPEGSDLPALDPPIGWPISSTRLLVTDPWGDHAPAGISGELFIGGPSVARGYLGQPALTAERFLPDPYGPPGSRMFRTGDLVRRRADGTLEFLGRADRQVKIRGYRVELDGLEHELRSQDSVADAAVTAIADPAGGTAVAAYVVPVPGTELTADGLRGELSRTLPSYLLPARLVITARLPRTTSGKVDYQSLAAIPAADIAGGDQSQTPGERRMAAIWADVLHTAEPGRDANFFSLGGNSLLAIQILSRVRDSFGVDLPLQAIFEVPTIRALTLRVQRTGQSLEP